MTVLEIGINAATSDRCASAHVSVDGREYLILGFKEYVTVLVGKWITNRRALGRTFWSIEELVRNYKRDGKILAEYAGRVMTSAK